MKHIEKYIKNLEAEICLAIEQEAGKVTLQGETELHLLFENLEHAREYLREREAAKGASATMLR